MLADFPAIAPSNAAGAYRYFSEQCAPCAVCEFDSRTSAIRMFLRDARRRKHYRRQG